MGGRNISTRVEDRGGVRVEINAKTGRGVGVRQISKNCWEARRPNPMKKGGWLKYRLTLVQMRRRRLSLRRP